MLLFLISRLFVTFFSMIHMNKKVVPPLNKPDYSATCMKSISSQIIEYSKNINYFFLKLFIGLGLEHFTHMNLRQMLGIKTNVIFLLFRLINQWNGRSLPLLWLCGTTSHHRAEFFIVYSSILHQETHYMLANNFFC